MRPDHECDGCGKDGVLGFCQDCRTPDYETEQDNQNVRTGRADKYDIGW